MNTIFSTASWSPCLPTPKSIMGFTISLLVNILTKYTRLHFVKETFHPTIVVLVSMRQVKTSYSFVQTKRKQSLAQKCFFRYSFRFIFGIMEAEPLVAYYNSQNVSNVEAFNNVLRPLLDNLRNRVASGNSTHKFALESVPGSNFQTIYALLQCTPDLSELDCTNCLAQIQGYLAKTIHRQEGALFVTPSCNLRYEISAFYDPSAKAQPATTQGMYQQLNISSLFIYL